MLDDRVYARAERVRDHLRWTVRKDHSLKSAGPARHLPNRPGTGYRSTLTHLFLYELIAVKYVAVVGYKQQQLATRPWLPQRQVAKPQSRHEHQRLQQQEGQKWKRQTPRQVA